MTNEPVVEITQDSRQNIPAAVSAIALLLILFSISGLAQTFVSVFDPRLGWFLGDPGNIGYFLVESLNQHVSSTDLQVIELFPYQRILLFAWYGFILYASLALWRGKPKSPQLVTGILVIELLMYFYLTAPWVFQPYFEIPKAVNMIFDAIPFCGLVGLALWLLNCAKTKSWFRLPRNEVTIELRPQNLLALVIGLCIIKWKSVGWFLNTQSWDAVNTKIITFFNVDYNPMLYNNGFGIDILSSTEVWFVLILAIGLFFRREIVRQAGVFFAVVGFIFYLCLQCYDYLSWIPESFSSLDSFKPNNFIPFLYLFIGTLLPMVFYAFIFKILTRRDICELMSTRKPVSEEESTEESV